MSLQHCPTCNEEYVAGVAACVECGGALTEGALPRGAARSAAAAPAPVAANDRLLDRMPGLQADHAVKALLLEGIACRLECQGLVKRYEPGQAPNEPFAITLPVAIYVAEDKLDAAREVLASFGEDDLIGEQWSEGGEDTAAKVEADDGVDPIDVEPDHAAAAADEADEPAAESTTLRTVVIIIAVLALLLLFLRR